MKREDMWHAGGKRVVTRHNILSSILFELGVREVSTIDVNRFIHTPDDRLLDFYRHFDLGLWWAWQKAEEYCEENNIRIEGSVRISPFTGHFEDKVILLHFWREYGFCTLTNSLHINFDSQRANKHLELFCNQTGFIRDAVEEMVDRFIEVYNGEIVVTSERVFRNR